MAISTVLVTGGSGLVGKAIQKISTDKYNWIFLSSKDCDLTDTLQTDRLFSTIRPDYVIHLAANVGGLFKNMKYKVDMLNDNIDINNNVIRAAHKYNTKKLIACLSTCIFPDNTTYPIDESMLHNGPPHHSNNCYAYAKRMLEVQCMAYQEQFGSNFVCVIPTNIYGEFDNFSLDDAHVIPALIHKCYLAKKNNQPFVVYGSGKPLRQFIYSIDLAKLLLWVLEDYNDKSPIILAPDNEVSIGYIAEIIATEYNYLDNMVFDTTKADGQYKKTASNKKLLKFNNFQFSNLESNIKKVIIWFNENYDSVRK